MLSGCTQPSGPEVSGPHENLDDNTTTGLVTNVVQIETGGNLGMNTSGWVKVYFSLTNQEGTPLGSFNRFNFSIRESTATQVVEIGSEELTVNTVEGAGEPLATSIVMDYSQFMADTSKSHMASAAKVFIALMMTDDVAEIIKFSDWVEVVQAYTSDKNALNAAVDSFWPGSGGSAALYDAIYTGLIDTYGRPEFKGLLTFSAGWDNYSVMDTSQLYSYADTTGIPCYSICLDDSDSVFLQDVANRTGGRYFHSSMVLDPQKAYELFSGLQKKVYILRWNVQSPPGEGVTAIITASYRCANGTFAGTARGSFMAP